jgi:cytochrome P450
MRIVRKALLSLTVFTDDDVVAHAITFFIDGFETSSTALSFSLYALATNPDVQERVREEVESVLKRHGGELTFDGIQEMTYLDMVFAGMLHELAENVI